MLNRDKKLIRQLHQKKFRKMEGLFLVEGAKSVEELTKSDFHVAQIFYTEKHTSFFSSLEKIETELVKEDELTKAGTFQNNDGAIAIAQTKPNEDFDIQQEYVLALDDVRDPGNLGTILRIADWFGIQKILCSETCAEFYNPKVIAASMGSFTRIQTYYCNLPIYLADSKNKIPIFGTFMNGENIHETQFSKPAIFVMGNESNGVSNEVEKLVSQKIAIPRFGKAESLNVAIATGIVCDNLMRS